MVKRHRTKELLWDYAWQLLVRSKNDRKHPFHTPVLSTVSPIMHPRSRTLVLRNVLPDTGQLWFYTDRRSQKATDLERTPLVSWTFWSPKQQIQVNIAGKTTWLAKDAADQLFINLPKHSRKAYATLTPPGKPQEEATDGLPPDWEAISLEETSYAADYFGVVVTTITHMEVLQLSRDGHQRLLGRRTSENDWDLQWLIP